MLTVQPFEVDWKQETPEIVFFGLAEIPYTDSALYAQMHLGLQCFPKYSCVKVEKWIWVALSKRTHWLDDEAFLPTKLGEALEILQLPRM